MARSSFVPFLCALLVAGCTLLPSEAQPPPPDVLAPMVTQREIFTVRRGDIAVSLSLPVSFGAEQQSVLYFRTGGRLRKLAVVTGQRVATGDLLAELDAGDGPYELAQAEIALEKAWSDLDATRQQYGVVGNAETTDVARAQLDVQLAQLRLADLQGRAAAARMDAPAGTQAKSLSDELTQAEMNLEIALLDLEDARRRGQVAEAARVAELKDAELALRSAELRVEHLRAYLAGTRIHAPYNGLVVRLVAGEGDQVSPYAELLTLAGDGPVVARAVVDEMTIARFEPGQAAELFPNDGDPGPVNGKVVGVPHVSSGTRIVVVAPDESTNRLHVGRNGRAEVTVATRRDVLLVPRSALREYGGRQFVTLVQGESRQEVAIEIGLTNDRYAEVLSGLSEGARVVGR